MSPTTPVRDPRGSSQVEYSPATTLHADADVEVSEAVAPEEVKGLHNLPAKEVGLHRGEGGAIDVKDALPPLAVSDCGRERRGGRIGLLSIYYTERIANVGPGAPRTEGGATFDSGSGSRTGRGRLLPPEALNRLHRERKRKCGGGGRGLRGREGKPGFSTHLLETTLTGRNGRTPRRNCHICSEQSPGRLRRTTAREI